MRKTAVVGVIVGVVIACAPRPEDACKETIVATRDKFRECTPDAGGFAELFELSLALAEAECANVGKGCEKPDDAGVGTYNAVAAQKCAAEIRATPCSAVASISSSCNAVCR